MKNLLCLLLLILCALIGRGQQSYTITGVVTDEKDVPIPGATVFIADSRKVTATNSDGRFVLENMQPGRYNLVVKMIGYIVTQHEFMLQDKDMRFRIKLPEDNVMLNTVYISGMSLSERKRHLATFIKCFLGTSANSAKCKILNTDDIKLRFDKQNDVLTAYSNEFLIIENKALGYRMKYLLNEFTYDHPYGIGGVIFFAGTLFFENIEGNAWQQKKWEQERANTYLGSAPHFFRSVFSNSIQENDFMVFRVPNPQALTYYSRKDPLRLMNYTAPVKSLNNFMKDFDNNFKTFDLSLLKKDSTEFYVLYKGKQNPTDFAARGSVVHPFFKMPKGQVSIIRPLSDSILISRKGEPTPVSALLFGGFWSWGQMSAFLPSDYEIPPALEPSKKKKIEDTIEATTDK